LSYRAHPFPASWLAVTTQFWPADSDAFSWREPVSTALESAILAATFSETTTMVPFFVQFKCKLGQSYAVANALAEAEIASEIYSTAGDYDLLVKFYVDNDTDIGHFVNEKVQVIPGIQDTHTIITFKAFGAS
jgi:DNA-binding Lrp family transcriptional regulator